MEQKGKTNKKGKVRKPSKVSIKRNNKYHSTITFFRKNNKWPSPTAKDPKEASLGQWIVRIRYNRNHSPEKLPEKIIQLVDKIDADKHLKNTEQWENSYYKLKDFINNEKRWPLPGSSTPEETKLYNWCSTQKSIRNGILQGRLDDERIKMLDAIGFLWNKNRKKRSWNESFIMVRKFRNLTNRWPVHATDPDETRLAKWCSKMRAYKNGTDSTGKLTSAQIKKLTDLGFEWEINITNNGRTEEQLNKIWSGKYTQFFAFIANNKRYPSPTTESKEEKVLYSWWMRMACLRRKGKLSNERIQLLTCMGFKWGKGKEE